MNPLTALDPDQVRAFVESAYGLSIRGALSELPQGVHSRAWGAHTDHEGDWVVKVTDPNHETVETIAAQCTLYDYLNDRALSTPHVRSNLHGERVSTITVDHTPLAVTLMRSHQLHRFDARTITTDQLRDVGAEIARLHTVTAELPWRTAVIADLEKSRSEWGRQFEGVHSELTSTAVAVHFSDPELAWLHRVDDAIITHLDAHFPDPDKLTQAILHGDLSFEHIRRLPNGQLYFFDFGDPSWGPVAHDLAQLLRDFQHANISASRWSDLRAWLLDGYRRHHDLTEDDVKAIDLFLLNRVVALAKYVLELDDGQGTAHSAEVIKDAYRLAESVLASHATFPPETRPFTA